MKWTGGKEAKLKAIERLKIALEKKDPGYRLAKNAIQGVEDFEKYKRANCGCEVGCTEKNLCYGYNNKWYCSKCIYKIRDNWYKNST